MLDAEISLSPPEDLSGVLQFLYETLAYCIILSC